MTCTMQRFKRCKEQIELDFKIEKQEIIDRLNNKEITAR